MPRDAYTDVRKAYAKAMGVDVRTAQRHQKAGHPDWKRFLGNCAVDGVKRQAEEGVMAPVEQVALGAVSPLAPAEVPEWYQVPDADLSPVQVTEKRAWEAHDRTFQAWLEMQGHMGDALVKLAYVRELPKLRENWDKARRERERWEVESRRLIPVNEFEAFRTQFIGPLAEMLANLPAELAAVSNPDNPAGARAAITEWLRTKGQRTIEAMLEGSREFAAAA